MLRNRLCAAALVLLGACAPAAPSEVRVSVTDDGFVPKVVSVEHGRPATLVITRKVEGTCATEAVFTETGRKYDLPLGAEVRIELPTEKAVTLHYACGMGMYEGQVVVK